MPSLRMRACTRTALTAAAACCALWNNISTLNPAARQSKQQPPIATTHIPGGVMRCFLGGGGWPLIAHTSGSALICSRYCCSRTRGADTTRQSMLGAGRWGAGKMRARREGRRICASGVLAAARGPAACSAYCPAFCCGDRRQPLLLRILTLCMSSETPISLRNCAMWPMTFCWCRCRQESSKQGGVAACTQQQQQKNTRLSAQPARAELTQFAWLPATTVRSTT